MKKNGETVYCHGIMPGRAPVPMQKDADAVDVEKIPLKKLKRDYLCMKAKSLCARIRACPCLDRCRYGQRYIELTRGEENGKGGRDD